MLINGNENQYFNGTMIQYLVGNIKFYNDIICC